MTDPRAPRASRLGSPSTLGSRSRWAVPAAVATVVAGGFMAPPLIAAAGDSGLPDVTVEQLLTSVAEAGPTPLSGTVVYTARLGLGEIPVDEISGADPVALLGGSSTLRVWTDGAERSRVSLLGSTSEYSVVRDGPEAWTYSSEADRVVHYGLSAADEARYDEMAAALRAGAAPEVPGDLPTPQEAARSALQHAEGFSTVSLDGQTTVAGRGAYQVVVIPRDAATLVSRVVVAVDAETSVPLRTQVWSTLDDSAPALEVGFTDVAFGSPDGAVLEFSSPVGAAVTEVVVPLPEHGDVADAHADGVPEGVSVTGTGWETVTEWTGLDVAGLVAGDPGSLTTLPGAERTIGSESGQALIQEFTDDDGAPGLTLDRSALYEQLTTEVPEGRLLSATLLSILVTDDGRVLVGAVPADVLRAMA